VFTCLPAGKYAEHSVSAGVKIYTRKQIKRKFFKLGSPRFGGRVSSLVLFIAKACLPADRSGEPASKYRTVCRANKVQMLLWS